MKPFSRITSTVGIAALLALPPLLLAASNQDVPAVPLSFVRPAPLPERLMPAAPVVAAPRPASIELAPLPTKELEVTLENINTDERATFKLTATGQVRPDQAKELETFFRCRRTGKHKPLAPGVLVLLGDIAKKWPGRTIEIVSGYRAPPFGAPHSRHFLGHAIDLRVKGVRTAKVRDYVWRGHQGVGVGHYSHGNFLHVDWRPELGDTAWSARQESSRPNYKPRWAKRARRGLPSVGIPVATL